MNLVICAMYDELSYFIEKHKLQKIESEIIIECYQSPKAIFAISRIGIANAASALSYLIAKYDITNIFNFGTVGTLKNNIDILDLLIVIKSVYLFADCRAFGYQIGQIPQEKEYYECDQQLLKECKSKIKDFKEVTLGTSDTFVSSQAHLEYVQNQFNNKIDIADMEGASLMQVASRFNIPIILVKVASDSIINPTKSSQQFKDNLLLANKKLSNVIEKLEIY